MDLDILIDVVVSAPEVKAEGHGFDPIQDKCLYGEQMTAVCGCPLIFFFHSVESSNIDNVTILARSWLNHANRKWNWTGT